MAFCINCGQELAEGAKFCAGCGKAVNDSNSTNQRKTVYDGEIHKCPNCGDVIDAYETICEACGFEIRGRKAVSIVHELALKLENTDDAKKKEELIRNFYIPNTKEDIYEFFILATSNIKAKSADSKAWFAKLEQAYQKAQITLEGDKNFEYFKSLYRKAEKANSVNSVFKLSKSGYFWALIFCLFGIVMFLVGAMTDSEFGVVGMGAICIGMWVAIIAIPGNNSKNGRE